jgi:tetratricopeptide (TPR) repeat protein
LWLPTLMSFAGFLAAASAHAAQYVVDDFTLGAPVDTASPNYRSYNCKPSDEIADAVRCERQQQRKGPTGKVDVSSTLIHAKDGTALYAMVNVAPVALSKKIVQREIEDLSKTIDAKPTKVMWIPEDSSDPTSVIAIWGPVTLEELGYDELSQVEAGEDPRAGILVDTVGDLPHSAKEYLPVYRLVGGPGYVYSASFGAGGKGHRHYVAVNAAELAVGQFQHSLRAVLEKDRSQGSNDYRLWPDVAVITRNLARDTSPDTANRALDKIFDEYPSSKLRSHVWSIVPLGTVQRFIARTYWRHDSYGPKTQYPKIRSDAEDLLAREPNDPFIEFAYFVVGDIDGAMKANPNSVIADILHYASGYSIIKSFMRESLDVAKTHVTPKTPAVTQDDLKYLLEDDPDDLENGPGGQVNAALRFVNQNPDLFDRKPLTELLTNFSARAAEARTHFEFVLNDPSSPQADDAAYMIGWLELQQGNLDDALAFFSQSLAVGNDDDRDYKPAALKQVVRLLERVPPRQQLSTVETSKVFDQEPSLWYTAARSAYRDFDYALAIDVGLRGLNAIKVPIDPLPVTTDPGPITEALEKINPELTYDLNARELPYLIEASREIVRYQAALNDVGAEDADVFAKKARTIIIKYSLLLDRPEEADGSHAPPPLEHKDLRQALHLIDITLQHTPRDAKFGSLRQWLHYRKVRILTVYAPNLVPDAISGMQQEFPDSELLNDALAEQIFAEGVMLGDVDAAQKTFAELLAKYPDSNGVDNAYSWMTIILRCAGRREEAIEMNNEIIRRFPLTRHAKYALERMADPERWVGSDSGCGLLPGDTATP